LPLNESEGEEKGGWERGAGPAGGAEAAGDAEADGHAGFHGGHCVDGGDYAAATTRRPPRGWKCNSVDDAGAAARETTRGTTWRRG
jgi:hypothetical protein